jgi:crotonobetainyl-CoA:carnitine CoA-transferase CaiB-like acyl-CoA transferase
MAADATLEILRRPDGEVVILSPAVPLSSLMVLGLSRLPPAPCRTSILGDVGPRIIRVEAPGTGTESARRSRPGWVSKSKWFSRSI